MHQAFRVVYYQGVFTLLCKISFFNKIPVGNISAELDYAGRFLQRAAFYNRFAGGSPRTFPAGKSEPIFVLLIFSVRLQSAKGCVSSFRCKADNEIGFLSAAVCNLYQVITERILVIATAFIL